MLMQEAHPPPPRPGGGGGEPNGKLLEQT